MNKELGLIFFENPISRTYLHISRVRNFKFKKILVLKKKSFYPNFLYEKFNFNKINFYPLMFLKQNEYSKIVTDISEYFGFKSDFYQSVYSKNKLEFYCDEIEYLNTDDINSDLFIEKILTDKKLTYLNTGNKIYKKIFKFPINILHIHPGYLPNIRGADASLWNIHKLNSLAATSFIMNQGIDTGSILNKTIYKTPTFKTDLFKKRPAEHLYRFWFSFVDPLIRGKHFDDKILSTDNVVPDIVLGDNVNDVSEYYSFMKTDIFKETFERVFKFD